MGHPNKYILPHTELSKLLSPEAKERVYRRLGALAVKYSKELTEWHEKRKTAQ